jgi:serine/threonine protein kinase
MTSSAPLGPGSLVGNRFIFEEQIGRGGMGTVLKARDLRKEEAGDGESRVAIKILNEEFKRHPNAVQALQREARKAQRLAHPNIVTVFDFDRDGPDVFMVMELLQGESLDRVIKDAAGIGVGFEEAFRIARGVCDAVAYAHERGIVHADFKPANVFLTREGVVKVLDFGIARAVKRREHSDDNPHTLFDPGTLNALTPAYAGYEVLEGQEPDVRDDIYAIACVFYELLTGKHPFNKLSAEDACKANLRPARPAKLSRTQWQVLRSALEFRRDHRPASAAAFLEGLRPKRKAPLLYFGLAAAASAAIAVMLIVMHTMTSHDRAVSAALLSQDRSRIEAVMPWLQELTPERRASIFLDDTARAGLVRYFTRQVDAAANPAQAQRLIKELWDLLPDSQAVKALGDRVTARNNDARKERSDFTPTPLTPVVATALIPDEALAQFRLAFQDNTHEPQEEPQVIELHESVDGELLAAITFDAPALPRTTNESTATSKPDYLQSASLAAKEGRLEDALNLANRALRETPSSQAASAARDRYAKYQEIDDYLQHRPNILTPHIRYKIWRVSKLAPDEMPGVKQRWAHDLVERLQAADDPKLVAHLAQVNQTVFR